MATDESVLATATRAVMRHYGYTDEEITEAERTTCETADCERVDFGWDCSDEDGTSRHPVTDELWRTAESVRVAFEAVDFREHIAHKPKYTASADDLAALATEAREVASAESRFPGPMTHLGVKWRTGRKVGRTIYAQQGPEPSDEDPLIGVMDTTALATEAVSAHNARVPNGT